MGPLINCHENNDGFATGILLGCYAHLRVDVAFSSVAFDDGFGLGGYIFIRIGITRVDRHLVENIPLEKGIGAPDADIANMLIRDQGVNQCLAIRCSAGIHMDGRKAVAKLECIDACLDSSIGETIAGSDHDDAFGHIGVGFLLARRTIDDHADIADDHGRFI